MFGFRKKQQTSGLARFFNTHSRSATCFIFSTPPPKKKRRKNISVLSQRCCLLIKANRCVYNNLQKKELIVQDYFMDIKCQINQYTLIPPVYPQIQFLYENPFGLENEIRLFKRREQLPQHNADGCLHPILASFQNIWNTIRLQRYNNKAVHRNCLPDSSI